MKISFSTLIITVLFVLVAKKETYCQSEHKKNLAIRADMHYGLVIPEYKHFTYLVNKPVVSAEISLLRQSIGRSDWEQLYKFPEAGLTLQFTTLGNNDVFGHEFGIFPYVLTPFIR